MPIIRNPEKHFEELRKKYRIAICKDQSEYSPLYPILVKMEKKSNLSDTDIKWLEDDGQFLFLGNYYAWMAKRFGGDDNLDKARYYHNMAETDIDLFVAKNEMREEVCKFFDKYSLPQPRFSSIDLQLHEIIKTIDTEKLLKEDQLKWLEKNHYFILLGFYYQDLTSRNKDPWMAVRSGGFWRKAEQPQKALSVTEGLSSENSQLQAAIYTNRGGAYRDQGDLQEAKQNAELAIKLQPESFYPLNLLGAICYQEGDLTEGDVYFHKAIELGSSPKEQENLMREVLKGAKQDEREVIAQYLLNKDPNANSWAKKFIKVK